MSKSKKKHVPWTRTSVQCVETGEIYDGVRAAAIAIDVSEVYMTNHLAGRAEHIRGKTYKRVPKED